MTSVSSLAVERRRVDGGISPSIVMCSAGAADAAAALGGDAPPRRRFFEAPASPSKSPSLLFGAAVVVVIPPSLDNPMGRDGTSLISYDMLEFGIPPAMYSNAARPRCCANGEDGAAGGGGVGASGVGARSLFCVFVVAGSAESTRRGTVGTARMFVLLFVGEMRRSAAAAGSFFFHFSSSRVKEA